MAFLGVSVHCVSPDASNHASGIKICDHFVLTHGTVVWSFLKEYVSKNIELICEGGNFKSIESNFTKKICNSTAKFYVRLPQNITKGDSSIKKKNCNKKSEFDASGKDINLKEMSYCKAYLERVFISSLMLFDFFKLFSKRDMWKFEKTLGHESYSEEQKFCKHVYLSTFLILQIKSGGHLGTCLCAFEKLICSPKKGATLFIDGCPFGAYPHLLLNSLSKGIVSNNSENGNIFLTDARCIIGCEGAPTYSMDSDFGVCGIVLSPFCWLRGEWIGLTFVGALRPLISSLANALEHDYVSDSIECELYAPRADCEEFICLEDGGSQKILNQICKSVVIDPSRKKREAKDVLDTVKFMEKCVVRVTIVSVNCCSWGSGVVVTASKGLVVTCGHVTDKVKKSQTVSVIFSNGECMKGSVIFSTNCFFKNKLRKPKPYDLWDFSIIELPKKPLYSLPLAKELPSVGTPVVLGGHPLFLQECLPKPSFSLGNLAKICITARKDLIKISGTKSTNHSFDTAKEILSPAPVKQNLDPNSDAQVKNDLGTLKRDFGSSMWHPANFWGKDIPIALQSTCNVYPGYSGGPLVARHPTRGPEVIGILSSMFSKSRYPHLNMSHPCLQLAEAVKKYDLTDDVAVFEVLRFSSSKGTSIYSPITKIVSKL